MRKLIIGSAAALASFLATAAAATTLTFGGLTVGSTFTTMSQEGFTVAALTGSGPSGAYSAIKVGGTTGDPDLLLPVGVSGINITGGLFTLGGFSYVHTGTDNGAYSLQVIGYLAGVQTFSQYYGGSRSSTAGSQVFDRVQFSQQSFNTDGVNLDDIVVSAATVPEPASWAMLTCGFGLLGWALRRPVKGGSVLG